ncbi:MAG TPA: glycosyltransferase [Terracidiphilus sp.]|nr:glycosyltransferase [Terracidiphilus sp.]
MKKRLAILTNMLTPYRLAAYRKLGDAFDTLILHGGMEPNRDWSLDVPANLKTKQVWTYQITGKKRIGIDGVRDTTYVHLNIGLLWSLPQFLPDVIITHEMGIRTVIALLYGKLMRVPVWVWWGGTVHSERNVSPGRKRLRRWMARHVRHWISYGATTTEYLESIGAPRKRILQIQNCVPQETFTVAPEEPAAWFAEMPRPVLLCVGQLILRKGVDKLIEACGRARARGARLSLVLVGKGPEEANLRRLAQECGLEHCTILPNQSQATLNAMYRAADVFVFPTLEDIWGLVVNEAMWAGAPVLCSQYAGCAPELLPAESIFDPMSPESFDAAIERAIAGRVAPPDCARLRTWQEVGAQLCASLEAGRPAELVRTGLRASC